MSGLPLEGLTVVAIEQAVAAPFASSRLADAGATVIKVERPEGDFARGYDAAANGLSSYFVWLNRGKASVVLDLATDAGKAALEDLIANADVMIQNLRPGAIAKLGFDPERLQRDYPKLVTCSITGFGDGGPLKNRKAYDLLIQAESALCSITGSPQEYGRVGISIVDIATGATAYSAILEALIRRGTTGRGARLSLSMFDVMADWMTVPLLNYEAGCSPSRISLAHPSIAPYGAFRPKSGPPVLISVQSDREWRALCSDVLRQPDLGTDPRFATNVARVRNRAETDALISRHFASLDAQDLIRQLTSAGIALASLNDLAGLAAHPHLRRSVVETQNGPIALVAPATLWDGAGRDLGSVPALPTLKD